MDFRYRLMRFMSGRNGPDEIFVAMLLLSAVLAGVNIFVRSLVLQAVVYIVMLAAIFRCFSRNTEQRRRENGRFLSAADFIKRRKSFYSQKKADKCHVYKKCPSCGAVLRLPRRVGVHTTVCPKCGKEFTVKVRK